MDIADEARGQARRRAHGGRRGAGRPHCGGERLLWRAYAPSDLPAQACSRAEGVPLVSDTEADHLAAAPDEISRWVSTIGVAARSADDAASQDDS